HAFAVELAPRDPTKLRGFLEDSLAAVTPSVRVALHATAGGIRIEAVWEPDLELAVDAVKRVADAQLRVGKLEVQYVREAELLEPVLSVCVTTPEDYMGDVIADMNRRRGLIESMHDSPGGKLISAQIPAAETVGYTTDLRIMTHGRAT